MKSARDLALGLFHRLGVSPLAYRVRRQARTQGARLRFGWRCLRWERGDITVLLPSDQPYGIARRLVCIDQTLHRAVFTEDQGRRILDLRGPVRYLLPSGRTVFLPAPIEPADTCAGYLARGAPRPGDVVLDVGAFCGEVAVELAILVGPGGHVFAMEPDPLSLGYLRRNLALHQLTNVTLLPHALWSHTTDLEFVATGHADSSVQELHPSSAATSSPVIVSALAPAEVFKRIGRVPDFIKMDIEGAEVEAIEALAPLLATAPHPVRLAIASYHLRAGRPTHELITPVLEAAGFTVETGYPEHLTTWAFKP